MFCTENKTESHWSNWSECLNNTRSRTLRDSVINSPNLTGLEHDYQNCSHGSWSDWSKYSPCSITCGKCGAKIRKRSCNNPSQLNGGYNCTGNDTESLQCECRECPGMLSATAIAQKEPHIVENYWFSMV